MSWATEPEDGLSEPLERAVRAALAFAGEPKLRVDVIVVDDTALAELHGRFLNDPTPTDVIAFDLREAGEPMPADPGDPGPDAELYISLDCARRVGLERGVGVERELVLYGVHGSLHLCGFDDHEPVEREAMRKAERAVLQSLGYADDPLPHE